MAERHIARFDISRELLARVLKEHLGMPTDTNIVHVEVESHWSGQVREITLYVEHPDLPLVKEGQQICRILPIITEKETQITWSWGQDDD
ncbi:MAG: hypothetical protein ACYTEQ_06565 [Planctomycetota bacterium]|jgi:hypothetical protein